MNPMKNPEIVDKRTKTLLSKRQYLSYDKPVTDINLSEYTSQYCRLNLDVGNNWLNENHPRRAGIGNRLILGIRYIHKTNGTEFIGAVMSFRKSRNSDFNFELTRMWSLFEYDVAQDQFTKLSDLASSLGVYNIVAYVNSSFERVYWYKDIGMYINPDEPVKCRKWANIDGRYYSESSLLNKYRRGSIIEIPPMLWDTGTVRVICK